MRPGRGGNRAEVARGGLDVERGVRRADALEDGRVLVHDPVRVVEDPQVVAARMPGVGVRWAGRRLDQFLF